MEINDYFVVYVVATLTALLYFSVAFSLGELYGSLIVGSTMLGLIIYLIIKESKLKLRRLK